VGLLLSAGATGRPYQRAGPLVQGLMPVRKAADKWLSLGENRVPTSARRQADELELDFLRHGSAPFGYFVRGPGVLGTAPTRMVPCAVS
jgi:hypothetical protein